jgi:hypothetical protein
LSCIRFSKAAYESPQAGNSFVAGLHAKLPGHSAGASDRQHGRAARFILIQHDIIPFARDNA